MDKPIIYKELDESINDDRPFSERLTTILREQLMVPLQITGLELLSIELSEIPKDTITISSTNEDIVITLNVRTMYCNPK